MPDLHPKLHSELLDTHRQLIQAAELPTGARLQGYYDTFRRAFGPEVLRALDGRTLLERMHAHGGSKDSLVYWLEFKDDEAFPAVFGSISGGSALKFGVFMRAETGAWATSSSGGAGIKEIGEDEAIAIAQRHRDQLLAAADLASSVSREASDAEYLKLQRDLERAAPDLQNTVWGHKYLSLIAPQAIDTFHVSKLQRYNLARVLQVPPKDPASKEEGRYVCAGRFVQLSHNLGISLFETCVVLNRRHGSRRRYWRIGTTDDEKARRKYWPMMRDGDFIAIGWPELGDLSLYSKEDLTRNGVSARLQAAYSYSPQVSSRSANQVLGFVAKMSEGDRVIAADGQKALGVAEVTGPYVYDQSAAFPHQRAVTWLSFEEWNTVDAEAIRTTVGRIRDPRNLVEIERRILDDAGKPRPPKAPHPVAVTKSAGKATTRGPLTRLQGMPSAQIQAVLERKGQAILYGPPGTGKTYWALRTTRDLAALRAYGSGYGQLADVQKKRINSGSSTEPALVRLTSFHPEYGYEDFIEGYRPGLAPDGSLRFARVDGVFRKLCATATQEPELDFYLIIDEINRGDIPRIFGELLTLLEKDKRGEVVQLPASGESFQVPPNVFVVGTMNTADRSIALLDVALRRRFGFVELMPDYDLFKGSQVSGLHLGPWLKDLNDRVRASGGGDARNRQIGHAFLLNASGGPINSVEQLAAILRDDIVPLLEEYAYDDFGHLSELLGPGLVDNKHQRVRRELFDIGRGDELIGALLRPEITTAAGSVDSVDETEEGDESSDDANP